MAKTRKSRKISKPVKTEREIIAEKAAAIGVPAEQIARGGHAIVDVKIVEGERVVTLRTLVNRGGTPVDRWKREGSLTEVQLRAIAYCQKLWVEAATVTGLVADPLKVAGAKGGDGWTQQEALDDLADLKARIPSKYWNVFEDVCRWDEPAGTAGSALSSNSRSAIDAARLCVCFVADLVTQWRHL